MLQKRHPPPRDIGVILVDSDSIIVKHRRDAGYCSTSCPPTVEGLLEVARILSVWMGLPHEDLGEECRRIASLDQRQAMIYEIVRERLEKKEQT